MTRKSSQKEGVRHEVVMLLLGGAAFIFGVVCFSVMVAKIFGYI